MSILLSAALALACDLAVTQSSHAQIAQRQQSAQARPKGPDHQAPPDIADSIKAVKTMVEIDHDMISRGSAAPILLEYDKQLLALVVEGADIWAKHDEVRAREFAARMNAIMAARDAAQKPYEAASKARERESAQGLAEAQARLDEQNRQVSVANKWRHPQSTGPHPCPTGPGPGEVQVGYDAGGQPFCQ
jgi:hypothetical protein